MTEREDTTNPYTSSSVEPLSSNAPKADTSMCLLFTLAGGLSVLFFAMLRLLGSETAVTDDGYSFPIAGASSLGNWLLLVLGTPLGASLGFIVYYVYNLTSGKLRG